MVIGCTGNYRKEEFFTILDKIHCFLKDQDVEILVSSDLRKLLKNDVSSDYAILEFSKMIKKCDIIFAIGGDGTILSTVRRLEENIK